MQCGGHIQLRHEGLPLLTLYVLQHDLWHGSYGRHSGGVLGRHTRVGCGRHVLKWLSRSELYPSRSHVIAIFRTKGLSTVDTRSKEL